MKPIPRWAESQCQNIGWTEPCWVGGEIWAFPPNGVMPIPLPYPDPPEEGAGQIFSIQHYYEGLRQLNAAEYPPPFQFFDELGLELDRHDHPFVMEAGRRWGKIAGLVSTPHTSDDAVFAPPTDPHRAAIEYLSRRFHLGRKIASIRIKEFCQSHQLDDASLYTLLSQEKITLRYGVLCEGKGYPAKHPLR